MEPKIQRIVERIVEAVKPVRIILFGSRARGDHGPESDIDLLVVYNGAETEREIQLKIHRLFQHPDFSLDVVVTTPEEMERMKNVANTLAREATENGVVCYG